VAGKQARNPPFTSSSYSSQQRRTLVKQYRGKHFKPHNGNAATITSSQPTTTTTTTTTTTGCYNCSDATTMYDIQAVATQMRF
jgi:hypothetical protein